MSGIAILGSCATRDVWRINGLPSPGLMMLSRHSLAGLFAPPVAAPPGPWGMLEPGSFDERCIREELDKTTIGRLEARDPDVLLIDLVSERHELLGAGGSIVLNTPEWRKSGLAALPPFRDGRRIPRLSPEAHALWLSGLEALRRRIQDGPLARARIVLHRCLWATHLLRRGEAVPLWEVREPFPDLPTSRAALAVGGMLMDRCHEGFLRAFPAATVVEARAELRMTHLDHTWGPGCCHFVDAYYHDLLRALRAAGVLPVPEGASREMARA